MSAAWEDSSVGYNSQNHLRVPWWMNRVKSYGVYICIHIYTVEGFPGSSAGKESACNAGDPRSIPGLGRSPGEGIGCPLQDSWASLAAQRIIHLQCGRPGFDPWVGKIPFLPGGGHGNPLYIPAWRIPMDRAAWWATVHGVTKGWTQLSN